MSNNNNIQILADAYGCPVHFNGHSHRVRRCSCKEHQGEINKTTNIVYQGVYDKEQVDRAREEYFYGVAA